MHLKKEMKTRYVSLRSLRLLFMSFPNTTFLRIEDAVDHRIISLFDEPPRKNKACH